MFISMQHPRQHETLRGFGDARSERPPDLVCYGLPVASPVWKSPACGGPTGVNRLRSGLRSSSSVPSRQSRPRTSTTAPSIPTSRAMEVPSELGRTGERSGRLPGRDAVAGPQARPCRVHAAGAAAARRIRSGRWPNRRDNPGQASSRALRSCLAIAWVRCSRLVALHHDMLPSPRSPKASCTKQISEGCSMKLIAWKMTTLGANLQHDAGATASLSAHAAGQRACQDRGHLPNGLRNGFWDGDIW